MSDVLVLAYHAVSESWSDGIAVHPHALERQMGVLLGLGYEPCTFTRCVLEPPAEKAFAVTFDDAFRSVFLHALPLLARLGIPATVFVPTAYVGGAEPLSWPGIDHWANDGALRRELLPTSWSELQSLSDAGWEIGSHTVSHPMLTRLSDEALAGEMADSRAAIEAALGRECRSLAYPYGDFDDRIARAAGAAGYAAAGTLFPGRLAAPPPLQWPRVGISHHHSLRAFSLKVSPPVRRIRGLPLPPALARAAYRLKAVDPPRRPGEASQ